MLNVGSSATRGSSVSVGVDVSSGELVAISDWHSTSSAKHGTEPECQAEHDVDRQTQVFFYHEYLQLAFSASFVRALLVYEIIVRFSRDFYEMILVGNFKLARLVKNAQVSARE